MDDAAIRKYLLGELPEAERDAIGQQAIADPEFHARIRDVENDLVDACALGDLDQQEDRKVREYLQATGQVDRLRFAQALARHKSPRRMWIRFTAIAAGASFAVWMGWLANQSRDLRDPRDLRNQVGSPIPKAVTPQARVASFSLSAGAVRDPGAVRRIRIPEGVETVELNVDRAEFGRYRDIEAELKTASGMRVLRVALPSAAFQLLVERRLLSKSMHELALTGIEASGKRELINYYYFLVE
ncbi:MAG: hypothetical protein JNL98_33760 [Bryobacterales bacterium]|nr:hypothetical protein [Bryobacterales bacterium]